MKYRYLVTDLYDGCVKGTNSEEVATSLANCEDFFVADAETSRWVTSEGCEEVQEI